MKWTSWAFLAFAKFLICLVLFIADRQMTADVDRRSKSALEADPNMKPVSERSPYMRTER
jgi:hypothetical protein